MNRKSLLEPKTVTIPQLALIGGTRGALGAGIAFLLADSMTKEQRRAVDWTLLAVGALTTIPIAAQLFSGSCCQSSEKTDHPEQPSPSTAGA